MDIQRAGRPQGRPRERGAVGQVPAVQDLLIARRQQLCSASAQNPPSIFDEERFMRILVVGAGALGGYFGGRLLAAGKDVSFLLRPRRAAQLAQTGLVIRSPNGDLTLPAPPSVQADGIEGPYDRRHRRLQGLRPGARRWTRSRPPSGPETAILPVLERHAPSGRAGASASARERVLGGLCMISAALDDEGAVLHLQRRARPDLRRTRRRALGRAVQAPRGRVRQARSSTPRASDNILQDMWEKWMLIASAASMTCLMRATVGDIVRAAARISPMRHGRRVRRHRWPTTASRRARAARRSAPCDA